MRKGFIPKWKITEICFFRWLNYRRKWVFLAIVLFLLSIIYNAWMISRDYEIKYQLLQTSEDCKQDKIWYERMIREAEKPLTVKEIIYKYADNPKVVEKIALCESQMGLYRENWEGSGAIGLLQFKPQTFSFYCEGDINNDKDQVLCFNKLFSQHKNWWECSKII